MIRHPAPTAMAICNLENFMASTRLRPEPKTLLKSRTVCSRRTGYFRGENEVCTFAVKVRITLVRKFYRTILATFITQASIIKRNSEQQKKRRAKVPAFCDSQATYWLPPLACDVFAPVFGAMLFACFR